MRSEVYFYEDEEDIPKGFEYDCENDEVYEYRNRYNGRTIQIAKNPPLYIKAIPIPNKATNGTMLMELFPNALIEEKDFGIMVIAIDNLPLWKTTKEWWDTPFKRNKTESQKSTETFKKLLDEGFYSTNRKEPI